mmetsp:Transcript_18613/g.51257  ORF Transcript_18613/g.51257 Transcript_18613/m.51257 type:complete len:203 (-) Transcript_18613:117-725(-)
MLRRMKMPRPQAEFAGFTIQRPPSRSYSSMKACNWSGSTYVSGRKSKHSLPKCFAMPFKWMYMESFRVSSVEPGKWFTRWYSWMSDHALSRMPGPDHWMHQSEPCVSLKPLQRKVSCTTGASMRSMRKVGSGVFLGLSTRLGSGLSPLLCRICAGTNLTWGGSTQRSPRTARMSWNLCFAESVSSFSSPSPSWEPPLSLSVS